MSITCSLLLALFAWGCAGGRPSPDVSLLPSTSDPDSLSRSGDALIAQQEYSAALVQYRAALNTNPNHAPALRGLASILYLSGDAVGAARQLATLVLLPNAAPLDFTRYAEVQSNLGDQDGRLSALLAGAERFPASAPIHGALAELYALRGDVGRAATHVQAALAGGESDASIKRALETLCDYYFEREEYDQARTLLEQYDENFPGHFDTPMRLAFIHFSNESFRTALSYYRSASSAKPLSVDARVAAAKCLDKLGREGAAIEAYRKALQVHGMSRKAEPIILAQANRRTREGDYDRALELVERAQRAFPLTPGLSCAHGLALDGLGEYALAIKAFQAATGDPQWSEFANAQIRRLRTSRQ